MFTRKTHGIYRLISVVMAFLLCITMMAQMTVTVHADNTTYSGPVINGDGQVTFYYQGNGTETDVFVKGSWDWNSPIKMIKGEGNLYSVTTTSLSKDSPYEYGFLVNDGWVNDGTNPCTLGNSRILRNPVMLEDGSVKFYYYPSHGEVPIVKLSYQKNGEDSWNTVNMSNDSENSAILSAVISPASGIYSYKLFVNDVETEDVSAATTQTFTVKKIPARDPDVKSPEITDAGIVFNYYAPTASAVYLAGAMNGWSSAADAMTYDEETGYWSITKKLSAGDCEYKFVVDGSWVTDPLNANQNNGNSVVSVPVIGGVESPVINNSGVTFIYENADAQKVLLAGTATTWDPATAPQMVKDIETGKWYITLNLDAGDYQYKYIVDGNWITDPLNAKKTDGNSAFTVTGTEKYVSPVINGNKVTFTYSGDAERVRLAGTMTDWQNSAVEFLGSTGNFSLEKELVPGLYEYKFIVNENGWMADPSNPDVNGYGNSLLLIPGLKGTKDSVVKGKAKELSTTMEYYAGDGNTAHKVNVTYDTNGVSGVAIEDGKLIVADDYEADTVTIIAKAGNCEAEVTFDVVATQYTYNIYYYDAAHNTLDSSDLWIWENNGAGATDGKAFDEAVVMDDGYTWLKASITVPYTDINIIPRSKGEWSWQSATVSFSNTEKNETQDIYILSDDKTAYTTRPAIKKAVERHLVLEYQRENSDFENWNIYTWNSGFGSEVSVDYTMQGDTVVFDIPIKATTGNVSFVMRKSVGEDVWAEKDGGDNDVITPLDQTVVRAIFVEGKGITYVYPYNCGHELDGENNQINFYYRDDEKFLKDSGAELAGTVNVEVNGTVYPMTYDEKTKRFTYTYKGLENGTYLYRFLVGDESITDAYNDETTEKNGITYSVCEYKKFSGETSATVTPAEITPVENAVLEVKIPEIDGMQVASITADASAIGGKKELSISPELKAITISVPDTLAAGTYEIPVYVKDQYGNAYNCSASVSVKPGSSDWDEAVIYFMVTDRFFDGNTANNGDNYDPDDPGLYHGGDFAGVTQKLDYLKDLGVNTIWITPIVENISEVMQTSNSDVPGTVGYHGYWADDFTKLDSHLGTSEEFETLIASAHEKGIKIMVDVVINHAGYDTESIFGDMIRDADSTVAGDTIKDSLSGLPDFATENEEVRDQLVKWQTSWVKNYGIDYFRVDTVKHVDDTTWQAFKNELTKINPSFKMIGEYAGAGYSFDGGQLKNGQMDSLLDFDFNNMGLELAQGKLSNVEKFLEKRNASLTSDATLGSFLSSHDEDGLMYSMMNELGYDADKAYNLMKVAATMQMTAKGQPVIYYGEEIGLTGANNYPYQTNRYDFDWSKVNSDNDMYNHYKKIIAIRNKYSDVFAKGIRNSLYVDEEQGVMVFERVYNGKHVITALNISDEEKTVTFDIPEGLENMTANLYSEINETATNLVSARSVASARNGAANTITIAIPAAKDGGTYVVAANEKKANTTDDEKDPTEDATEDDNTEITTEDSSNAANEDVNIIEDEASSKDDTDDSQKSESGNKDGQATPNTGNNDAMLYVIMLLMTSSIAGLFLILSRKKERSEK